MNELQPKKTQMIVPKAQQHEQTLAKKTQIVPKAQQLG